jgi:DNA-directed RNA polymerase subunit K/omega
MDEEDTLNNNDADFQEDFLLDDGLDDINGLDEGLDYDSDEFYTANPDKGEDDDTVSDNDQEPELDDPEDCNEKTPLVQSTTIERLTKYERVHLLSTRAQQLSLGSSTRLSTKDFNDLKIKTPLTIALLELARGVLPLKIKRIAPNGIEELI